MKPAFDLYLITDPATDVVAVTRAALATARGRVAVQLRDKARSSAQVARICAELASMCRDAGAPLFINADCAGAIELVSAHGLGLHLSERAVCGTDSFGRSCHDTAGLARATREGAAFATLGPIGPVPHEGTPLSLSAFERLARAQSIPIFALGGVSASSAGELVRRGAHGVAVIRAVYAAADPAGAVASLLSALDRAREGEGACATR